MRPIIALLAFLSITSHAHAHGSPVDLSGPEIIAQNYIAAAHVITVDASEVAVDGMSAEVRASVNGRRCIVDLVRAKTGTGQWLVSAMVCPAF
jgi:hypothetical protein